MIRRRDLLVGLPVWVLGLPAAAAPERADLREKRLRNRLELWESYASRTRNLIARYVSTRYSSLLYEPLTATGSLAFAAPSTLVLRDDGPTGSTTWISPTSMRVRPNQTSLPPGPDIDPTTLPAARWLGARLISLFAPATGDDLIAGLRTHVPKGKGYRLELLPERGSVERKALRALAVKLDPVGGAVLEIEVQEAQGDRLQLRLSDHRQNVADDDIGSIAGQ